MVKNIKEKIKSNIENTITWFIENQDSIPDTNLKSKIYKNLCLSFKPTLLITNNEFISNYINYQLQNNQRYFYKNQND